MEEQGGIGAASGKKKGRSNTVEEQRRQRQETLGKAKMISVQEERTTTDFGDGSTIEKDWSLVYGMVCKVIKQMGASCWSRCLICLVEAAFNKGKRTEDMYYFAHRELVQAIKMKETTKFEVGSINDAVKRIAGTGLVKMNSRGSWDEDGYRARWKIEVKPEVNSEFVKEKVRSQVVGIIMDVDSEFLEGTGKELYRVRAIGRGVGRHALIIIGYGRTKNGQFFFICQNSWGKEWGFNGLGRLIIDDTCPVFIFYTTGDQLLG